MRDLLLLLMIRFHLIDLVLRLGLDECSIITGIVNELRTRQMVGGRGME